MPAGREMDALVAEKVMGCTIRWYDSYEGGEETSKVRGCGCNPIKHDTKSDRVPDGGSLAEYSTQIYDAWEVVEKVRQKGILDHIEERNQDDGVWVVQFCAKPNDAWWHEHAYGDTVPVAICRAALKATGA